MTKLGLSREEAIQLINEDIEIDHMTIAQANADLTDEQKKATKAAKNVSTHKQPTIYNFDNTNRKRAPNENKRFLIETIKSAIAGIGSNDVIVTNIERELTFNLDGTKYKIVLSVPRN